MYPYEALQEWWMLGGPYDGAVGTLHNDCADDQQIESYRARALTDWVGQRRAALIHRSLTDHDARHLLNARLACAEDARNDLRGLVDG